MPLIVDKEEVRQQILESFQDCIRQKPLMNISLRDIATKAGMSHAKLLNYFPTKDALIIAYCDYTKEYITEHCKNWFLQHHRRDYESNLDYLNAFMEYVANGDSTENRPNATIQTYILAQYNPKIKDIIREEFKIWRQTMEECLIAIYGNEIGKREAEAMMVLITGTFVCNYTDALTGCINNDILSHFIKLSQS